MSWSSLLKFGSLHRHLTCSKIKYHIFSPFVGSTWNVTIKKINFGSNVNKTDYLNPKVNQEKDKLLFCYENPKYYRLINIAAIVQFLFWVNTSEFFYRDVEKVKSTEKNEFYGRLPSWLKIDLDNKNTRLVLSVCSFAIGYLVLAMVWMYTTRTVRMLVLRKGGNIVSLVTYTPFGGKRTYDIPLEKMSTYRSRNSVNSQLPLKVQGKWFYYILDTKNGTFHNPDLFDRTAGMFRTLK